MRAASTAWMLEGSAESPSSAPTATSCSRKSGLPSASSTMRGGGVRLSASGAGGLDERARLALRERVERDQRAVRLAAPPRPAASRTNSGRARQMSRIGCPLEKATR